MSSRSTFAMAAILLCACDKSASTGGGAGDASSAASAVAPVASSGAVAPRTSAPSGAPPEGTAPAVGAVLGEVPAWRGDKPTGRCAVSAAAKPRLEAISKGTDAALTAGTADLSALVKEVGADVCFTTRKVLATALFEAGNARHDAKKIDEATRYWRAALVVRPSLVVARYRLACGLALGDKRQAAATQLSELARAAAASDANAVVSLEKAKTEHELDGVRGEPTVVAALASATSSASLALRQDADLASKTISLLPDDFRKMKDEVGATPTGGGYITYKPAVVQVWVWHPDASTELLVATIIDDPAKAGKPKPDLHMDYGALAVLKRDAAGKVTLLTVRKTGESPPTIAAGKDGTLLYSFEQVCGGLSGVLSWDGTSVGMRERNCREL